MQKVEELKGIQIMGAVVQVILDGFGSFTLLASKILLESKLGTADEKSGMAVLQPEGWYPLDGFLKSFQRIGAEFGDVALRQAGIFINQKAALPADLTDMRQAFRIMDPGYHFNHARDGRQMFNPETGEMLEGIGHFATAEVPGKKQITVVVDGPYPCAFDEGIILGLARRFDAASKVAHDPKGCRKRGAGSCTYHVNWT